MAQKIEKLSNLTQTQLVELVLEVIVKIYRHNHKSVCVDDIKVSLHNKVLFSLGQGENELTEALDSLLARDMLKCRMTVISDRRTTILVTPSDKIIK